MGFGAAVADEFLGNVLTGADSHEDDEGVDLGVLAPVDGVGFITEVAGDYGKAVGDATESWGDTCEAGYGGGRTDAWDEFDVDTGFTQKTPFFCAAAEDEGVTAFEADHFPASLGVFDESSAYEILDSRLFTFYFAGIDEFNLRGDEGQNFRAYEAIVEDNVCRLKDLEGTEG